MELRGIIGRESPRELKKINKVCYCGQIRCSFCDKSEKGMYYIIDDGLIFFLCPKCWIKKV